MSSQATRIAPHTGLNRWRAPRRYRSGRSDSWRDPAPVVAGYQFPLLVALLGSGEKDVGREVGLAFAWNTASVESSQEATATVTIIQSQVIVDISPRIIDITDTAEVTVQVRDEDGISLVEGHEVRLTANLGTLDPETVTTDSRGEAKSTYTAGTRAGNDTVTAFFGNANPGTDTVDLRTAPASIILTAGATTIPPEVESTVTFTATVADAEGLLLSNEVVNFSLQEGVSGTFNPGRTVTTDSGGNAAVSITFQATSVPPVGSRFAVTATARGGISDTVFITVQ